MDGGIDISALRAGDICEVETSYGHYFTVKVLLAGPSPVGEELGTQNVYDLRKLVIHKINGLGPADACKRSGK